MSPNLFQSALARKNDSRPPVWFMRQAGRYHSHYQQLKKNHTFMDLCKKPELACETTMGPIRDFDFDAAILFSDLLFPLEAMGMDLKYDPGPVLGRKLKTPADVRSLKTGKPEELDFQAQAIRLIRKELSPAKGLLGFVGGPFTLYCYAVEGSHQGSLGDAVAGLSDGRYELFFEKLAPLLAENMALQARAGIDTIAVLDTCAGELEAQAYAEKIVPTMRHLFAKFKELCPQIPITYYSKKTGPAHWSTLTGLPIAGLGIDWNHDIAEVLNQWSGQWAIQGNVDPSWLLLPAQELEPKLRAVFEKVRKLPREKLRGWICGLGHGVLQQTPESNVRLFLRLQKEYFR